MADEDTKDEEVTVRVAGSDARCRHLLDRLGEIAEVRQVRGPYRRRTGGVHYHADTIPKQRMGTEPGS